MEARLSNLYQRGHRFPFGTLVTLVGLTAFYAWAWRGTEMDVLRVVQGAPNMVEFVGRMFPPDPQVAGSVFQGAIETLQIGVFGTTLGAVLALPLGFMAASNFAPGWLSVSTRTLLNGIRTVPLVLFAIFFVSAVGLGPLPGTLATAIYSAGMLGKFYAEAVEEIDPKEVEGVASTGGTRLQILRYAILPQVLPLFVAYTLYRLEINIREGSVLGLVGAGGIGFYIQMYVRSFQYPKVATVAFIVLVMVVAIDFLSYQIRRRLA